MANMPIFKSSQERDRWIIDHAEYFTVVRRKNLKTLREEAP